MNDFFRTGMGRAFFEVTLPNLVRELARLNDNLEKDREQRGKIHEERMTGRPANVDVVNDEGVAEMVRITGRWGRVAPMNDRRARTGCRPQGRGGGVTMLRDYTTGERLEGAPSERLVIESRETDSTGAVGAYRDEHGVWQWVDESDERRTHTVYVEV